MKKLLAVTALAVAILLLACKQENKSASPSSTPIAAEKAPENKGISVGSKVYAHAPSGLVLRKTPSKDGEKITTIPCDGQALTVLELPDPSNRFVAEKYGDFEVAGGWTKVKAADGKEGYLFEGYLSRYPPMIKMPEDAESYLEWYYATVSPKKGAREPLPDQPGLVEGYKQRFEDGAVFRFELYEGGVTHHFYIPQSKMTAQEALVLFRPLWFQANKTKGSYDAATKTLTITLQDEYAQMTIQPKDGQWALQFSSAD